METTRPFSRQAGAPSRSLALPLLTCLITLWLAACNADTPPAAQSQRLVDQFTPEDIVDTPAGIADRGTPTEWRFDGPAPASPDAETWGWQAGAGISGLEIDNGALRGRATTAFPILHLERTSGLDDPDPLHEIQIRLRASAGTELSFLFLQDEEINFPLLLAMAKDLPWQTRTPLVPGGDFQDYRLESFFNKRSSDIRHILIRPTDSPGATFEIESLSLVFRKDYLAAIKSGLGWHQLGNDYHESVVTRAPESIRWHLTLPRRPWLDLAVGTVEDQPVTFKISVADTLLLERTVSTPQRWEDITLSLEQFAGQELTLDLSLEADEEGTLGLWGSPAIRNLPLANRAAAHDKVPAPAGVIFILADTLRLDRLDLYGNNRPTAPFLRQLAGEGAYFEDAVAQASWTKASAISIMTSLYPSTHKATDFLDRLPRSATTLAEVYRAAGYATYGLSSIPFTGHFANMHQGFETLHETDFLHESKNAREYVDRLLLWLEGHHEFPFFAFLHVFDPHSPYEPRRPFNSMWSNPQWHEEHRQRQARVRRFIEEPGLKVTGTPTEAELAAANIDAKEYVNRELEWYDGSIREMDVEIRRLFERLEEMGLREETLVVFVSDHGEEFHEHGRMFHGQSIYGELINVPLLMHYPLAIPGNTVIQDTVQLIDVMPTVLDLSGLAIPEEAQGRSLLPLLITAEDGTGGQRQRQVPAFSEKPATKHFGTPAPRTTESTAIILNGWKLIHNSKRLDGLPEFELYDHRKDPLDQTDLAADNPQIVERLKERLAAWRKLVTAQQLHGDAESVQELSQEELQRLRALGYL